MGPTWGPSGADRTQVGPMLARELCYMGIDAALLMKLLYPRFYMDIQDTQDLALSSVLCVWLGPEFPYDLKTAILKPLLKKLGLDPENFKNLRPFSNIAFLSKLLESLACEQYVDHLKKCNLAEMFQSAYRERHSVETALVRVHNDIMRAFDEKKSVILVLLNLSTAFDTVDHDRLLAVLNSRIGITGAALSWFESYLKGRTQHVAIKNVQSGMTKLKCGVSQGSVLGPVLFTTYLLPLDDILRKFGLQFHCYADDT